LDLGHERALDFGNVHKATRFILEERLADMDIILRYDSCDGEVRLPVLPEWCLLEERALRPITDPAPPRVPASSPPLGPG
jgi:hypothetical protein